MVVKTDDLREKVQNFFFVVAFAIFAMLSVGTESLFGAIPDFAFNAALGLGLSSFVVWIILRFLVKREEFRLFERKVRIVVKGSPMWRRPQDEGTRRDILTKFPG